MDKDDCEQVEKCVKSVEKLLVEFNETFDKETMEAWRGIGAGLVVFRAELIAGGFSEVLADNIVCSTAGNLLFTGKG